MIRVALIAAALLGAVVIAGAITLVLEGGGSELLPPAAQVFERRPAAEPAAPPRPLPPTTPMRMELRPPAPPVERVSSRLPAEDPSTTGPSPRIVGGPGISPGPVVRGRMERDTTPPPVTPESVAPQLPKGPQWQPFTQVVVIGAGLIDLGGRKVRLASITVPAGGAECRTAGATEAFDCAFLSMQALRQRIRARGVECRLETIEHLGAEPALCRIGITDLGQWLIAQGWAGAAADAPEGYRSAEISARCAGAGIWQTAPRPEGCPTTP